MRHTIKWSFAAVVVAAAALLGTVGAASAAQAKSLMVCSSGCPFTTIAEALNAAPTGSKITVGPGPMAAASSSTRTSNLSGGGADQTDDQWRGMVVTVASGVSTTISAVTITGGEPDYSLPDLTPSGGILNNGVLTLKDSAITNNSAVDDGGGIYNSGSLTLIRTVVRNNTTGGSYNRGGGIYNNGKVVLKDSSVEENWGFLGGGIENAGGTATLTNSAVSGNSGCAGPGALNETGTMVIKGSTLSNNTGLTMANAAPEAQSLISTT